eukprot:SAG31_NODE_44778_length_261_cov_0.876543_1_plen_40_part_10
MYMYLLQLYVDYGDVQPYMSYVLVLNLVRELRKTAVVSRI